MADFQLGLSKPMEARAESRQLQVNGLFRTAAREITPML